MLEMTLVQSKETENKLRWQADVDGVPFELYIPKWRVPLPWPTHIRVAISERGTISSVQPGHAGTAPTEEMLEQPIRVVADRVREQTKTVRFKPRGDKRYWELGEPYIPYSLLPSASVINVHVEVRWARSVGT